jgi:MoCo/4Fe-4S cofactor protein with predicted Tat translocation signal
MSNHHDHDHEHDHDDVPAAPLPPTPEHGYWKSLRELDGAADWQLQPSAKEFPPGADQPPPTDPLSRRNFFHLMGASMGLAGLGVAGGCRRYEKEEIVPLARRPEDQVPGTTLQYATTYELGGSAHALIATSFEGRPIKLDGNPEHPFAGGGIIPETKRHAGAHTFAQASILHLYDPDRASSPLNAGKGASLDAFKVALGDIRRAIAAGGARVLSEATSSPTVQALRRKLEKQNVGWHEYEPISWDNERAGTRMAFGRSVRPLAKLDHAQVILTIDCDLFVEHPASMRYCRDFAKSRRKDGTIENGNVMSRLYSVESTFTNTGVLADHRLPLRSELGLPFAMALDAALGGGVAPSAEFLKEERVGPFIQALADDLKAAGGRAIVLAGRRQSAKVHAVVAKINAAIGAVGQTLDYVEDPDPDRMTHLESITQLAKDMQVGRVSTLIILGGNPVYDAPVDLDFAGSLAKVNTSIHLGEYADETSQKTTWHVPRAHYLEAWGDARTWDGTISIAQPLIAPLYGGLSSAELLSLLLGDELGAEQLVRTTHEQLGIGNWRQNVHDGYVPNTQLPVAQVALAALPAIALDASQLTGSRKRQNELEVTFQFSSATYDGRYANNAWLWETPDFLTKVVWDTYALVSPETSQQLGLPNDTMISVKVGDKTMELPCYVMPGQARYSIALVLGGGRTEAGHVSQHPKNVGEGEIQGKRVVGWDAYKVRSTGAFDYATGCSATSTGKKYELADVQDHWSYKPGAPKIMGNDNGGFDVEVERRSHDIIRETTRQKLDTYRAEEEGEFWDDEVEATTGHKRARHLSLFEEKEYTGHRWAMSIDLSSCTGCNACMVACQSENNVPVVGRREVINNREMHWIRIDRYFQGSPDFPHVVHQPLTCQQCENAPCEQVCPVGATQHSEEGLNDMAYNRCIGTRYCANNCPYKVRRFNFLDWNSEFREAREKVRRLLFNPDVTVRMRGVMEKCTYCVQRIQNGKIRVKAQIRAGQRAGAVQGVIPDGEIETACQMACPTEAIVFGDLSDQDSRVAKLHAPRGANGDRRSYALLPETYTKPRTRYLARVRNPNPRLEKQSGGER